MIFEVYVLFSIIFAVWGLPFCIILPRGQAEVEPQVNLDFKEESVGYAYIFTLPKSIVSVSRIVVMIHLRRDPKASSDAVVRLLMTD
jgi:hypothetical protein